MKLFQDSGEDLLKRAKLHSESYRVLKFLDTAVEWGNGIPKPAALAKQLGLNERAVYRAYAELVSAEIVIKAPDGGRYSLSPFYCWKGNEQQYNLAVCNLPGAYPSPVRQLIDARG